MNWDLIPEMAIARMTLMPNNPLFGLNATGVAMNDLPFTPERVWNALRNR